MEKAEVFQYILNRYGVEADYPFATAPDTVSFRNYKNKKWFALLMDNLEKRCLGLNEEGKAAVLNLKCDPLLIPSLIDHQKIFRGYHMNKEHWISVLLDSSINQEELAFLVEISYRLVDKSKKPKEKTYEQ